MTHFSLTANCLFLEGTVNELPANTHFITATNQSSLLREILSEFWQLGRNNRIAAKKSSLKSLHFILAQSGNSIIATACPLKSS